MIPIVRHRPLRTPAKLLANLGESELSEYTTYYCMLPTWLSSRELLLVRFGQSSIPGMTGSNATHVHFGHLRSGKLSEGDTPEKLDHEEAPLAHENFCRVTPNGKWVVWYGMNYQNLQDGVQAGTVKDDLTTRLDWRFNKEETYEHLFVTSKSDRWVWLGTGKNTDDWKAGRARTARIAPGSKMQIFTLGRSNPLARGLIHLDSSVTPADMRIDDLHHATGFHWQSDRFMEVSRPHQVDIVSFSVIGRPNTLTRKVTLPGDRVVREIVFSPSGSQLAWLLYSPTRTEHSIWVSDRYGRSIRRLFSMREQLIEVPDDREKANGMRQNPYRLRWRPDGKALSFIYEDGFYLLPVTKVSRRW